MKTFILILLTLQIFNASSQEYKYHAIQGDGLTVKSSGIIKISDSLVIFKSLDKGYERQTDYDLLNQRNGKTYFTDGVETYDFYIQKASGKKKGKKYEAIIYYNHKYQNNHKLILYYITKED